ncbi:PAS domain S-box protein [Rubellimicrobium arenae]|uniref:PAS domain S-box protein n=1 Tax=Rubellimicrobium arenae TaxID=2817372 RepID=UPI001B30EAA2|nr:PAS domain S-box protein [Rubellimicrobium arenae]
MARRIRELDWSATPLGPVEGWPERLKVVVEMMLASPLVSTLACGPERVFLYNDAAGRLYGQRHPQMLGRPLAESFPRSYPEVIAFYDRSFAGEPVHVAAQPADVSEQGGEIFEAYLTPVRGSDGRVIAVHMTGFEVGRRLAADAALRESEERQAALLKLADALRPLVDPIQIQSTASRILGEHLRANRVAYAEDLGDGATVILTRNYTDGVPGIEGRYSYLDYGEDLLPEMQAGRPVIRPDIANDPRLSVAEKAAHAVLQLGATLNVPQVKDGRLVAILAVHYRTAHSFPPQEVALVQEVAERTWAALERARAEEAFRRGEERFRAIVETARDYAIFAVDAAGRIEAWPTGAREVFGWSAEEAIGQPVDMTFTPEDRARGVPEAERSTARIAGAAPDVRWHLRKDGSRVFIDGVTRPLTGPDGAVTGFLKVGQDVTERRATEDALHESEARFRQFGDASADVLWIRNAETLEFEYVSPAFEEIHGAPLSSILDGNHVRRWLELVLPEDRALALDHLRRVREGEHVLHAYRVLRPDGEVRWIRDTGFPLLDDRNRVQRLAGIGHDATEEVELNDRLRVLVAELQHRSRNLMSVVRGVADRTLTTSETLDDFRPRFRARLEALGRVNGLLSRLDEGQRITFDQLLRTELAAHGVLDGPDHGEQVELSGPAGVPLPSATVQTFALALHELATNALKHGALSRPEGRLRVSWSLQRGREGERRLRVEWREHGVPVDVPDDAPAGGRQGYGRVLIELALPYQLRAPTTYELTAEGLRCTVIVPVSSTLDVAFSSQRDAHA